MKAKNLVGATFGKLSVKHRAPSVTKNGTARWACLCECGNETIVKSTSLTTGSIKSCGCGKIGENHRRWIGNRDEAIWRVLYSEFVGRSKKFVEETDITFAQFKALSSSACFYCGLPSSNIAHDRSRAKNKSNKFIQFNGLDRVDSSRGYLFENVVPSCRYCNTAKNNMTQHEFYSLVQRIYNHSRLGVNNE